jgi:hypothetical protein
MGILKRVALIGKLFGRSKGEPVEIKVTAAFVPDKSFRRATKRIFAKYKETFRKLGPWANPHTFIWRYLRYGSYMMPLSKNWEAQTEPGVVKRLNPAWMLRKMWHF